MTRSQLRHEGFRDDQLDQLLRTNQLATLGRGMLLAMGASRTHENEVRGLTLITGGVASHRSAAFLHQLIEAPPTIAEVTVSASKSARRPGIIHRTSSLPRSQTLYVDGIRCTNPARTLFDLAAVLGTHELENALETALRTGRTTFDRVVKQFFASGGRGRAGTATLREVLGQRDASLAVADSRLEVLLYSILRSNGVPLPRRQFEVIINGRRFVLDLAFPERRLFIEGDGFGAHSGRGAFERDRARQNLLVLAGWRPLRYTWRQICHHPLLVAEQIRAAYLLAS